MFVSHVRPLTKSEMTAEATSLTHKTAGLVFSARRLRCLLTLTTPGISQAVSLLFCSGSQYILSFWISNCLGSIQRDSQLRWTAACSEHNWKHFEEDPMENMPWFSTQWNSCLFYKCKELLLTKALYSRPTQTWVIGISWIPDSSLFSGIFTVAEHCHSTTALLKDSSLSCTQTPYPS